MLGTGTAVWSGTISTKTEIDWFRYEGGKFTENALRNAWLLALATYGVGDVVTSIALIWFSPLHVEANPVIAGAIATFGGGGFLAVKLLTFFAALGISLWAGYLEGDPVAFYGPPFVLMVTGALITAWNMALLL